MCPNCKRAIPENSEQSKAVEKRGKCLGCICKANELIKGANDTKHKWDEFGNYFYSPDYEFIPNGAKINI